MNISAALIEARERFGLKGGAREFRNAAGMVRQVGVLTDPMLVVYGEGATFEDAFLRARPPAETDLPETSGREAGVRPIVAYGPPPVRTVYACGLELRLSTRDVEALAMGLSVARTISVALTGFGLLAPKIPAEAVNDFTARLDRLERLVREGLVAIGEVHEQQA